MIADHLSRVVKTTIKGNGRKLAENFPDEQLFQLSFQLPWYADIVNFIAYATRIQLPAKKEVKD